MHRSNDSISKLEKRTILVFSLFAFLFVFFFFAYEAIQTYRSKPTSINFAVHDPVPRTPPGFHLITLPIFLSLIRPRRFLFATVLTALYAGLLLLSFYLRVDGESFLGGPIPGDPGFFKEMYLKTWIWDYVAIVFLVVLLPWLLSILYRIRLRHPRTLA